MKKRLAFIVNVDWFFLSHRLPLAKYAIQNGWEVFLLTKDTGRKEELKSYGIKVYDVPFQRTSINPIVELRCLTKIYFLLRQLKPDIVHNVTWKGCLLGGLAARWSGNRHVVNALSGLGSTFIRKGVVSSIMGYLSKMALNNKGYAFILQNPDDMSWFETLGYATKDKLFLIKGSGVDLKEYAFQETIPSKQLKVLFPARMLRDKGLMELIEAFNILRPRYEGKIELILAGSCSDDNKTSVSDEELQRMLCNGYMTWIGHQNDMYPVYVDSDIVVLPSYREGLPKALIEACAVGRPIVTTDVPGCRECVDDGQNGYLVPVKNPEKLADAIEKLIVSEENRRAFGIASRKKAEKEFSLDSVVAKTFKIYELMLNN